MTFTEGLHQHSAFCMKDIDIDIDIDILKDFGSRIPLGLITVYNNMFDAVTDLCLLGFEWDSKWEREH